MTAIKLNSIAGLMIENTPCMGNPEMMLHPSEIAVNNALNKQGNREITMDREKLVASLYKELHRDNLVELFKKEDFCFVCGTPVSDKQVKIMSNWLADAIIANQSQIIKAVV